MTHDTTTITLLLMSGVLLGACSSDQAEPHPLPSLVINELQPANRGTITDESGEADDWIEILNVGSAPIDMLGFSLHDASGTSQVLARSLVVPPGGFQLLWADDSPAQGPNHLGFKLSAKNGDQVTLVDPSGRTVDAVGFGPATGQDSYARFPDGSGPFAWCAAATPAAANGNACAAR